MAIVSGFQVDNETREEFGKHVDHEIDIALEPEGRVTFGCLTCHEILIELYQEENW